MTFVKLIVFISGMLKEIVRGVAQMENLYTLSNDFTAEQKKLQSVLLENINGLSYQQIEETLFDFLKTIKTFPLQYPL